jgi:hypothetical protein
MAKKSTDVTPAAHVAQQYLIFKKRSNGNLLHPVDDKMLLQRVQYIYSDKSYIEHMYGDELTQLLNASKDGLLTYKITVSQKIRDAFKIVHMLLNMQFENSRKLRKSLPLTLSGAKIILFLHEDAFFPELEDAFLALYKSPYHLVFMNEYTKAVPDAPNPDLLEQDEEQTTEHLMNAYLDLKPRFKQFFCTLLSIESTVFDEFVSTDTSERGVGGSNA